jgi:hypothetical protein
MAGLMMLWVSCERKDWQGQDGASEPVEVAAAMEEPAGVPVPVGKEPPFAEAVPGKPGFVRSPFDGKVIDVRGIPAGTLVADPNHPADEKHYFRVPEAEAAPAVPVKPPGILDPARLIDPAARKPAEEPLGAP